MKKFLPFLFSLFLLVIIVQLGSSRQYSSASLAGSDASHKMHVESSLKKLKNLIGPEHALKLESNNPLIINFWASWCAPCIAEFKSINKLMVKYGDKVNILGINNDDENPELAIRKTKEKYKLQFDSIVDPQSDIASLLRLTNIPSTVIIHNKKVLFINEGQIEFVNSATEKIIKKAISN